MSEVDPREEVLATLSKRGLSEVEIFTKQGRSRRLEITGNGQVASTFREQGWGVRAGSDRSSFFASGTGRLRPEGPWPEPDGRGLDLPAPGPVPRWNEPSAFDSPPLVEVEAGLLIAGIADELDREMAGARVEQAVLEEGTSTSSIVSSRGTNSSWRGRVARMRLEARDDSGVHRAAVELGVRDARDINPLKIASRIANWLHVVKHGQRPHHDRGEFLLAPVVVAEILGALVPHIVGRGAADELRSLQDRGGRLASRHFSLIDDGRMPGGVFEAPVDGEGMATKRVTLIEEGGFRQPLLPWWEEVGSGMRSGGCCRRASWRDAPGPGISHLYVDMNRTDSVANILGSVGRGYYAIEALAPARVDVGNDYFEIRFCGFALRKGASVTPISDARLCGSFSGFLRGIQVGGRDRAFAGRSGTIGTPTLLVVGPELAG